MGCGNSSSAGPKERFHLQYKIGAKVGEGAFAQVRLAKRKGGDEEICAVKIIDMHSGEAKSEKSSTKMIKNEETVWRAVGQHNNCVALYEVFYEERLCYMVMEKCQSSLMDKLSSVMETQESDLSDIFYQMLSAVIHCHHVDVVHRDIKPDNFLLAGKDEKTVKLCDFGLAAQQKAKVKLQGTCGTAPYMSPEMLAGHGYNEKTDVWSIGATVYLMLFGEFPYMPEKCTSQHMKEAIRNGKPPPSFKRPEVSMGAPSDEAIDFAKTLLDRSPKTRHSPEDARKHNFVKRLGDSERSAEPVAQKYSADSAKSLGKVMRRARTKTMEFKRPVDPTHQNAIDDLLTKLNANGPSFGRSFSNGFSDPAESTEEKEKAISRKSSRYSTHSGVVGTSSKPSLSGLKEISDTDSTASGGSETTRRAKLNKELREGIPASAGIKVKEVQLM